MIKYLESHFWHHDILYNKLKVVQELTVYCVLEICKQNNIYIKYK